MLYREKITISSEIHAQHVNPICLQNVLGLSVKRAGTYSNHWARKREHEFQPPFAQWVFADETHGYAIYSHASLNDGDTFWEMRL
jgi:hypothetical protein